jgi:hypothetical protein
MPKSAHAPLCYDSRQPHRVQGSTPHLFELRNPNRGWTIPPDFASGCVIEGPENPSRELAKVVIIAAKVIHSGIACYDSRARMVTARASGE